MNQGEELLDTLACEWEKRPKGAPGFVDLAASVRDVRRTGLALVVEYDGAVAAPLEELVAAERLCCPELGWQLEQTPALRLRITATPRQLDVLAAFIVQV